MIEFLCVMLHLILGRVRCRYSMRGDVESVETVYRTGPAKRTAPKVRAARLTGLMEGWRMRDQDPELLAKALAVSRSYHEDHKGNLYQVQNPRCVVVFFRFLSFSFFIFLGGGVGPLLHFSMFVPSPLFFSFLFSALFLFATLGVCGPRPDRLPGLFPSSVVSAVAFAPLRAPQFFISSAEASCSYHFFSISSCVPSPARLCPPCAVFSFAAGVSYTSEDSLRSGNR